MNELITVNNGQPVVSSVDIAEHFCKEHKNVLQTIENITAENSAIKSLKNFCVIGIDILGYK